jgi:hypothetical protein
MLLETNPTTTSGGRQVEYKNPKQPHWSGSFINGVWFRGESAPLPSTSTKSRLTVIYIYIYIRIPDRLSYRNASRFPHFYSWSHLNLWITTKPSYTEYILQENCLCHKSGPNKTKYKMKQHDCQRFGLQACGWQPRNNASDRPKIAPRRSNTSQECPREPQRDPERAPKRPTRAPTEAQEVRESPKRPQ